MLGNRWGAFPSEINKHPFLHIGASVERGRFNIEVGVKGVSAHERTQKKIQIAMAFAPGWVFLNLDTVWMMTLFDSVKFSGHL